MPWRAYFTILINDINRDQEKKEDLYGQLSSADPWIITIYCKTVAKRVIL